MNHRLRLSTFMADRVWLPWATCGLLLLFGAYILAFAHLPKENRFFDLKLRQQELRCWEKGVYPNTHLYAPGVVEPGAHTVYPPTSLVQLWLVSPFKSFATNVRLFMALNTLAFIGISLYAWRLGSLAGRSGALFTMSAVWAMSATLSSVKSGHHGLMINALLILMSSAVMQRRGLWAGLAWTGAMIKPHVGLSFAAVLAARRQWLALATGLVVMGMLGWGACAYTGHTLMQVLEASYVKSSLSYASLGDTLVHVLTRLEFSHRAAVIVSAMTAMAILFPYLLSPCKDLPILVHLAAAGVAGRLGFYHLHVDDVMLTFLLLGLIENALRQRSSVAWGIVFAVGITVWTPQVFLVEIPGRSLRLIIWPLALLYLTLASLKRLNGLTNDAPKVPADGD